MKDYDEYTYNLLNRAPDQHTRDALEARLTDYKGHLFYRAATFEHQEAKDKNRRDLHDMVDSSANTVRSDAALFNPTLGQCHGGNPGLRRTRKPEAGSQRLCRAAPGGGGG